MPVDRRDAETPQNDRTDLEVWLRVKGPDFLRRNAANIVLAIAVLIALGFLFYSRHRNKQVESLAVQQNVAAAYDYATQLRQSLAGLNSPEAGTERQQRAQDALNAADVVLGSEAATTAQKAIAQLVKADVYWALANVPAASLSTTQPVLTFTTKTPEAYLADAETAYGEVLRNYADEPEPVAGALLSLAAVAENRRDFAKAAEWYERAIAEQSIRPAYRDAARARLALLPGLKKPYVIATTAPASQPAASQPSVPPLLARPASQPTLPAAATPAPTSAPTTQP